MTFDWQKQAICRGMDVNLFFGTKGDHDTMKTALEVCNGGFFDTLNSDGEIIGRHELPPCPVRDDCLEFALSFPTDEDQYGIFGGRSPNQRKKIRDERRRVNPIRRRNVPVPLSVHRARIERDHSRIERDSEGGRRASRPDGGDESPPFRRMSDDQFQAGLRAIMRLVHEARALGEQDSKDQGRRARQATYAARRETTRTEVRAASFQ